MARSIETRLTELEANIPRPPCKVLGHDQRFIFVFSGRNDSQGEVEAKMAEIRNCGEYGNGAQFHLFVFGEETAQPAVLPAPIVAGGHGFQADSIAMIFGKTSWT